MQQAADGRPERERRVGHPVLTLCPAQCSASNSSSAQPAAAAPGLLHPPLAHCTSAAAASSTADSPQPSGMPLSMHSPVAAAGTASNWQPRRATAAHERQESTKTPQAICFLSAKLLYLLSSNPQTISISKCKQYKLRGVLAKLASRVECPRRPAAVLLAARRPASQLNTLLRGFSLHACHGSQSVCQAGSQPPSRSRTLQQCIVLYSLLLAPSSAQGIPAPQ